MFHTPIPAVSALPQWDRIAFFKEKAQMKINSIRCNAILIPFKMGALKVSDINLND
jgi:hypothetical protein